MWDEIKINSSACVSQHGLLTTMEVCGTEQQDISGFANTGNTYLLNHSFTVRQKLPCLFQQMALYKMILIYYIRLCYCTLV